MPKIILDTNVLVSSLIQQSYPYLIVSEVFDNSEVQLCLSEELFQEYFEVLNRNKFKRFPDFISNARTLLMDIKHRAIEFSPTNKVELLRDKGDNKLLELAEASEADFLITGNSNDFTILFYKRTRIISPKDYYDAYIRQ